MFTKTAHKPVWSRGVALATTLLFVALSMLAAGPHPLDGDLAGALPAGLTVAASPLHADAVCPLCDWVAHSAAISALVPVLAVAPAVQSLSYIAAPPCEVTVSGARPVGRAPPCCFI